MLIAAIALVSLALLPFVPILPGLGSLLALGLLICYQEMGPRWLWVASAIVGAMGVLLAGAQLVAALATALSVGP